VKCCAWPGVCFFKVPSKPVYCHKSISNFQAICLKFTFPNIQIQYKTACLSLWITLQTQSASTLCSAGWWGRELSWMKIVSFSLAPSAHMSSPIRVFFSRWRFQHFLVVFPTFMLNFSHPPVFCNFTHFPMWWQLWTCSQQCFTYRLCYLLLNY